MATTRYSKIVTGNAHNLETIAALIVKDHKHHLVARWLIDENYKLYCQWVIEDNASIPST